MYIGERYSTVFKTEGNIFVFNIFHVYLLYLKVLRVFIGTVSFLIVQNWNTFIWRNFKVIGREGKFTMEATRLELNLPLSLLSL